jgi:SagB-type dehydrogenase family enzyme
MNYRHTEGICHLSMWLIAVPAVLFAAGTDTLYLPQPDTGGGKPLMQVLNERKSSRVFSDQELSDQVLGDLLWAGFGVNRPASGKRTAPSARNWQEIDVYVCLKSGCFRYDAQLHALVLVRAEDIRTYTGTQSFVARAPVNLVYVADLSRMHGATEDQKTFYSAADAGFISQNVYLFCASEGLATVVRGLVDRGILAEKMQLGTDREIILAQTVGYPGEQE